ncbi:dihydroorotate dehydrogenase electron transfer subunit [Peptoniphilus catoniae]|uniref:dihydroorotate dehydrogenase electron transfer subunit n=1 Tax=Peptoniphilus catoniae TaxID=1660341 RepID=UPI0010FDB632|nr:dihydroorotate dehydrogenase electron transfer subunit [Peptoniphilus catoniae]
MAKVIFNKQIDDSYFLIKTDTKEEALPGQFYMLRAWDKYPTLSRPISIYDKDPEGTSFLIEKIGPGTQILSKLKAGNEIKVYGPYGNSFNYENIKSVALIGGGVGTAPFYYLAKTIRKHNPQAQIDFYIGERENQNLEDAFQDLRILKVNLKIKKGGLITDIIQYDKDLIYACGPDPMMKAVKEQALKNKKEIYLSLDKRMGCGLGACLSCTCKTKEGNKRSCKEGPIFKGSDLIE